MKKVSIIIRTKNEEKWIKSCLNSLVSQTYDNYEIILVDNESTDDTLQIVNDHTLIKKDKYCLHHRLYSRKST